MSTSKNFLIRTLSVFLAVITLLSLCTLVSCGEKTEPSKTPTADKLEKLYNEDPTNIVYKLDWFSYSWFVKGLSSFKNPASVELVDKLYYAKNDAGEIKYFLIETRAENSFGGKTVGYVKVTSTSVAQVDWKPTLVGNEFEGEKVYTSSVSSMVRTAVAEYIAANYQ